MRWIIICWLFGRATTGTPQVSLTETALPILRITTTRTIPQEPKITATLTVIDNGPGAVNRPEDPPTGYQGYIGIERRGQSSAHWAKGSYAVETRRVDGSNNDVSLLGLPEENDWVLHGPFQDRSLLRNVFVYGLGRDLLAWSPRTRYVELFINDSYRGVYVLVESIKRDRHRVDIERLRAADNAGTALTGGYLLKIDKGIDSTGFNHFKSAYRPGGTHPEATIDVLYVDPEPDELTAAQRRYIQAYFRAFEEALAGPAFAEPDRGYAAFIDVGSFVDYLILSELTGNLDAYRVSTYFHKERGQKLVMGPLWDYNFSLGSTFFCDAHETDRWRYAFNERCPGDRWLVPFWWERLLEDPAFVDRVHHRYTAWRKGPLHLDSLYARLDAQLLQLGAATDRDYARWPGVRAHTPYHTTTYGDEVAALRTYLADRLAFLDGAWLLPPGGSPPRWTVSSGPVGEAPQITYHLAAATAVRITLYDLTGQLVHRAQYRLSAGRGTLALAPLLPPGNYVLQWHVADQAPEAQLLVRY